jgi:hypothetical protein
MSYTVQFFIAGYAAPSGRAVEHCSSLREIGRRLQAEQEQAEACGAGYEPPEVAIFFGRHKDVTDMYPDRIATLGPRGGVRFE